jgi:dihydroflavonol-4-reductase
MILVTGGTGLLGSHLLLELTKTHERIRAIRRGSSDTRMVHMIFSYYVPDPDRLFDRIEWVEADLMDFGAMEDAMEGITRIYHAGAVVSFFPSDHKSMLKVNVEGTANLVNMAIEKKIQKFCYVSSIATLGRADNTDITDEETYWKPSRKNSVYSISKYGAEREVFRGIEEGLNAFIVNPSVILGPGFWEDNSGLFRLVYQGLKYYTQGVNGYVDVRDVVKAMILLMESDASGERFIVSADNCSYQQIFGWMARYLGKPAPSINVPPLMTKIAWRFEAVRSVFLRRRPEVTREMAITTSQIYTYSNEKIRKRIGFEFIPVEQSIKDTCALYLKDVSRES